MQRVWRPKGFAAAVAALLLLFVAVAAADALSHDEEFASPPAAARPLQPIARAAGNASLAPMSDWGLTPEKPSGAWMGPNPQQLSLPLLTGMRTLKATPAPPELSQLGCLKCKLDSIVSGLGDTLEFEDIFENTGRIFIVRSNFGHAGYPVKPFQKGIVNGMHNLYDKSIPDKSTGGNLLYWAVSTYKEGWDEVYGFVVSGPMNYDPAAAAACDVDGNLPDNPCLKGGSLHTTWTYNPPPDDRRHYFPSRNDLLVHIYIWWWPADERPRQPLIGQRLHFLFVELALISKDLASAAAVPGASNDLAPNPREPRVVQELFQLMEGRAHAADAFSRAVAFCTRMTPERPFFEAPLDLTAVQVCAQGLIARDYGAPRGILVETSGVVGYNPSGHLDQVEADWISVENTNTNSQTSVSIRVIMLARRQALGPGLSL